MCVCVYMGTGKGGPGLECHTLCSPSGGGGESISPMTPMIAHNPAEDKGVEKILRVEKKSQHKPSSLAWPRPILQTGKLRPRGAGNCHTMSQRWGEGVVP